MQMKLCQYLLPFEDSAQTWDWETNWKTVRQHHRPCRHIKALTYRHSVVLFFNISPEFHITLNNVSFMNCRCYGCSSPAEACEMKLAFGTRCYLQRGFEWWFYMEFQCTDEWKWNTSAIMPKACWSQQRLTTLLTIGSQTERTV